MNNQKRLAVVLLIIILLSYSIMLLLRESFLRAPTFEGGWGVGLDASRQYIVDTGRQYTDTAVYSRWYFPRTVDQHLQLLNAISDIATGASDPVSAALLSSLVLYPTILLVLVASSWFLWVGRAFSPRNNLGGSRLLEYSCYAIFAVFPSYALVGVQTFSYPGYTAVVYMFFVFTVMLRRLTTKSSRIEYTLILAISSFALFNMYHSTSLEFALILVVFLAGGLALRRVRAAIGTLGLLLVMYIAVGLYQNVVLLNDPVYFIRYLSDVQAISQFSLNASVNQETELGNPATLLFGVINIVVVVSLGLAFVFAFLARVRRKYSVSQLEVLAFLVVLGATIPMVALFVLGGISFLAGRFRDQVLIWILLLVLPILVYRSVRTKWRILLVVVLTLGIVASATGYQVVTAIHPRTYLSEEELSTSRFVWTSLPATQFVFTDWTRGTALMYGHRYTYGPDPYTMSPGLFDNLTFFLFYSNDTHQVRQLIPSAIGSENYTLYISVEMVQKGPGGPDHTYRPANPTLFNLYETSPYYDLIYSTGATILLQPAK